MHCTNYDLVDKFRKRIEEDIYTCMEFSGQSYPDVASMPAQRLYNYLKWKVKYENKKKEMMEEQAGKIKMK